MYYTFVMYAVLDASSTASTSQYRTVFFVTLPCASTWYGATARREANDD